MVRAGTPAIAACEQKEWRSTWSFPVTGRPALRSARSAHMRTTLGVSSLSAPRMDQRDAASPHRDAASADGEPASHDGDPVSPSLDAASPGWDPVSPSLDAASPGWDPVSCDGDPVSHDVDAASRLRDPVSPHLDAASPQGSTALGRLPVLRRGP